MTGDAADRNDDELLSQIDELKARMDRLMRGGTSTSNSALLTDAPRPASDPVVKSEPAAGPPPARTTVRDLIGPQDTESVEPLPSPSERGVSFPTEPSAAEKPAVDRPPSSPPPSRPKPAAVDGSLIAVDEAKNEPRPRVESFDDIETALEQELAKDVSVPPVTPRKGPDLASRFGPAEESVESDNVAPEAPVVEEDEDAVAIDDEPVAEDAGDESEEQEEERVEHVETRSPVGAIVAIWVFTAVTSGAIATLHFTGII